MRLRSAIAALVVSVALVAIGASLAAIEDSSSAIGTVRVTGFAKVSIFGSSGATTITLTRRRAKVVVTRLTSLPATSSPNCFEESVVYNIMVRLSGSTLIATGVRCAQKVVVTEDGKSEYLWDRKCTLLRTVQAVVPPAAHGTRETKCAYRNR